MLIAQRRLGIAAVDAGSDGVVGGARHECGLQRSFTAPVRASCR